jgi:RNA-directed DNA polymerase
MNVRELQRKLSQWATQDKERQFFDLYKLVMKEEWLRAAHAHVRQNRGSVTAGMDGITMKVFEERLEENLRQLHEDLKAGTFVPLPVRRVAIREEKAGGRVKVRRLGIPAIRDRIVQEALRMVLEPIYEADFHERSYGFRPNRCTMDAVTFLRNRILAPTSRYYWVIEGDIASYFDTINHRKLLRVLKRRIQDRKLLRLIWQFLRAGVMEGKLFRDTKRGTPQGGIASPALANVYLHELDRYMARYTGLSLRAKRQRRKQGLANFLYVRYGDDFIVLCNGTKAQAEAMRQELHQFLKADLKLELSLEKTKVTHVDDGFKFLGFWLQRKVGRKGTRVTKILILQEAPRAFLGKIRRALKPATHRDSVKTKVIALNRIIQGWGRYYQYTSSPKAVFHKLDYQVFWLMAHWLGRKYQLSVPKVLQRFHRRSSLGTATLTVAHLGELPTKRYLARVIPNPYLAPLDHKLQREELFSLDAFWTGTEARPGQTDWRDYVIERDGPVCRVCGGEYPVWELELDHIQPRGRYKRADDADRPENFQLLCSIHHQTKTQESRHVLSRMKGELSSTVLNGEGGESGR